MKENGTKKDRDGGKGGKGRERKGKYRNKIKRGIWRREGERERDERESIQIHMMPNSSIFCSYTPPTDVDTCRVE